jgi:hypothetical protein
VSICQKVIQVQAYFPLLNEPINAKQASYVASNQKKEEKSDICHYLLLMKTVRKGAIIIEGIK